MLNTLEPAASKQVGQIFCIRRQDLDSSVSLIVSAFQHSANVSDGCTLDIGARGRKRDMPFSVQRRLQIVLRTVLYCIAGRRLTL